MKEKIKTRWIEALRSGEYKQARTKLKKIKSGGKESFCCLGVLCDLYAQDNPKKIGWNKRIVDPDNKRNKIDAFSREVNYGGLPNFVRDWSGITWEHDSLIMNDEYQYNFKQIADWIEESL